MLFWKIGELIKSVFSRHFEVLERDLGYDIGIVWSAKDLGTTKSVDIEEPVDYGLHYLIRAACALRKVLLDRSLCTSFVKEVLNVKTGSSGLLELSIESIAFKFRPNVWLCPVHPGSTH